MPSPIAWFEVPVRDLDRARAFYQHILAIEMALFSEGAFRMAWFSSGDGSDTPAGALMASERYVPSHEGTLIYFAVHDVGTVLERVAAAGGKILNPKVSIGEFGFVGHFEDTEGNRVGLRSSS